jgi:cAMP-dependent protein kinase regulator
MNPKEIEEAQNYIRTKVAGVLERMTVDILEEKPKNVTQFILSWLDETGEKTHKECLRKIKNRPVGVETSESEDEEEVDAFEYNPTPGSKANALRFCRNSVSAEVYGAHNSRGNFKAKIVPKSSETKALIRDLLSKSILFSNIEDRDMETIVGAMEIKQVRTGDQVIKQGDDGFELYIVGAGQLKCTKKFQETPNVDTFIKNYETGEYFGELALLYNAPRAASIFAVTDATLYVLDRECFNYIVKDAAIKHREKFEKFLSEVELLSSLSNYERSKICDCLTLMMFEPEQRIIREGEKGNTFFLVIEGEADALKVNPATGKEEVVLHYKEKTYFGELSLLRDTPRAASVVARTRVKLASIDRNSFKRLLGPLEEILKRNAEKYKKFVH